MFDWSTVASILLDPSFLLYLPISSSVSQIIKELHCSSSSSYSFNFRHLSFNGIMKEAVSSQNMTDPIIFLRRILFRSVLFSPIRPRTCSFQSISNKIFVTYLRSWLISHSIFLKWACFWKLMLLYPFGLSFSVCFPTLYFNEISTVTCLLSLIIHNVFF